ncbi:hypothetical protein BH10ACI1_BH10ACI1_03730 [soil metagenome]
MEKFRQFINELSVIKRIALLSFFCLLLQAVVFYFSLFICLSIIQPHPPTMFEERANSFSNFMFLIVPLILFFSAFVSSLAIFSLATPKESRRKIIFPAFVTGLIQTLPLVITIPLTLILAYFSWHFVLALAPIYLMILISLIAGNLILVRGKTEILNDKT